MELTHRVRGNLEFLLMTVISTILHIAWHRLPQTLMNVCVCEYGELLALITLVVKYNVST